MSGIVASSPLNQLWSGSPRLQLAAMDLLCRKSFVAFYFAAYRMLHPGKDALRAQYILALLHQLEQLVTGDLRRLVVNLPPRHGKTEFGTIMLAAWLLARDPTAKVFVVSYGLALSESITAKIRRIIEHDDYKRMFPNTRLKVGRNRAGLFVTTQNGECMACSQDSAMTGFGTDYMLIDDFQKADEALSPLQRDNATLTLRNTMLSRFDNPGNSRILVNQQRLHEDDLSGFCIGLGWPQLKLPAIATQDERIALPGGRWWHRRRGEVLAPDHMPRAALEELKRAQGHRTFSAQYQQDPDVSDSGLIDLAWFGEYEERPDRSDLLQVVQSWDPAITDRSSADWSVGMTWGYNGNHWFLLDIVRAQIIFPELVERVVAWHRQWRADVLLIEGASIGNALWQQVKQRGLPGQILNPPATASKIDRLAACTGYLATGDYVLPNDAPWLEDLRRELLAFPDGRHDDQVDALSQFIQFAGNPRHSIPQYNASGRRIGRLPTRPRPRRYPPDQPAR